MVFNLSLVLKISIFLEVIVGLRAVPNLKSIADTIVSKDFYKIQPNERNCGNVQLMRTYTVFAADSVVDELFC